MMDRLELFNFEGTETRVVVDASGDPWFVAADVARGLGYRDAAAVTSGVREHHKGTRTWETPGGPQQLLMVSESGLFRLLLRANGKRRGKTKEEGERLSELIQRFQDWVTDDVLPAIRKTGSYSVAYVPAPAPFALPRTYVEALRALADEAEAREAAEQRALTEATRANTEAARADALVPAAAAWGAMGDTTRDYSVAEAAKILARDPAIELGRNRLFGQIVALGMAFTKVEHGRMLYMPYQVHVDAGRLALKLGGRWQHPKTGEMEAGLPQLRITIRGLEYLHKRLGGSAPLALSEAAEMPTLPVAS